MIDVRRTDFSVINSRSLLAFGSHRVYFDTPPLKGLRLLPHGSE